MRRVRGLVLLLGLVLIAMQYATNPDHWLWLTDGPLVQQPKEASIRNVADPVAAPRKTADDEPLETFARPVLSLRGNVTRAVVNRW
jgi:hypothetical protein